jgi:hypothetical protein
MESLRDIINDINNKEIKNYYNNPMIYVYTSKNNIEKLKQNKEEKYNPVIEEELNILNDKNSQLEDTIFELESEIQEKEDIIDSLKY